jgi:hypothetical protein
VNDPSTSRTYHDCASLHGQRQQTLLLQDNHHSFAAIQQMAPQFHTTSSTLPSFSASSEVNVPSISTDHPPAMSSTPDQDSALIIAYQHHKLEQKKSLAQVAGLQQQILNRGCAGSSPDMMRGLQKMAKQAQHKAESSSKHREILENIGSCRRANTLESLGRMKVLMGVVGMDAPDVARRFRRRRRDAALCSSCGF